MKKLLILGAGTAGTMMANKMRRRLEPNDWQMPKVGGNASSILEPNAPPPPALDDPIWREMEQLEAIYGDGTW